MEWPADFYAQRAGASCPLCEEGRPEATDHGVRFFAGDMSDAYLVRADVQRGLSVVVARAIQVVLRPVKLNYDVLGNSVPHLHTHLVPRYADDPRPGWPFPFPDADLPAMPEDRLLRDAEALRRAIVDSVP